MKLVPYTNLPNAIPAVALASVNVTVMFGPKIQLAAVLAVLAVFIRYLKIDFRAAAIPLLYLTVCVGIGVWYYGTHQAVIKAAKLSLFFLASAMTVRGISEDKSFSALVALRVFLGLCALNFAYAAATGQEVFRAEHFIEFSIYSAYTIAILYYLARARLTLFDRGCAWIAALLCGSTTALAVLILAEIVGRRFKPRLILGSIAFAPVGLFVLDFLMKVRGKELTLEYLATSDRARIYTAFFETTLPSFSPLNWLFGFGVGRPLHDLITADEVFNSYLARVGEGEIYSFCLHNEALHVLCDYGLVGIVLVLVRMFANCKGPVLILLGVCMMTNAYIYSFSGALIASSLFNQRPLRLRKKKTAHLTQERLKPYHA